MDIRIRHEDDSDKNDLFEVYSFTSVTENTSQLPYLHSKEVAGFFQRPNTYTLVAEVDGKVVGHISLFLNTKSRQKHAAGLAIAVHPKMQGKGIGKKLMSEAIEQADKWLSLLRLELEVFEENKNAIALYESMGFCREGLKRFASFKNGTYANLVIMSRLHPDLTEGRQKLSSP